MFESSFEHVRDVRRSGSFWLVIDEALDGIEDDVRKRDISMFKDGLENAAIIYIGRPETKSHFFTRVLHLIKDPHGSCFVPDLSAASVAPGPAATLAVRPTSRAE